MLLSGEGFQYNRRLGYGQKAGRPSIIYLASAGVAELADAQDLGSCGVTPVEVQVLSPAPNFEDFLFVVSFELERQPFCRLRPFVLLQQNETH